MNLKQLITNAVLISLFTTSGQLMAQSCEETISTKPSDPENTEMDALFPTSVNPWLNSFDFGAYQVQTFDPIYINPGAGWQVPDWTNPTTFQMSSPFTAGGASGGDYLLIPQTPFHARDFHWEDGWELLWLGTGYYPNGESINTANPNRIIPQAHSALNPRVPYMIYYNRYTGKIRLFAGLFTDFGAFQSASVTLAFKYSEVLTNNINGVLRHLSGYDAPLDQPSKITLQQGVNSLKDVNGVNNIKTWYTFDFQMAYDPCVCQSLTSLNFNFEAVSSSDISLYGRMITLEEDLVDADGNPIYDDGFLSAQDVNSNSEDGYIMRDKMSGLVDDYNESLEVYKQQMEDREFGKLGWFQDVLGDLKGQIVSGAASFIPGGQIAATLIENNLNLGADSSDVEKLLDKGGKAILGQGYDFLSTQVFGKNVKPVKPTIPTASFSEMRFSGTVDTENLISLQGFYTPGNDVSLGDLTPFNYPAYNKPMGLYATLKTPQVQFLSSSGAISQVVTNTVVEVDSSDIQQSPIFVPAYIKKDSTIWKTQTVDQDIYLKLKDPLSYALNHALDFNEEKTKVYVSFSVELENADSITHLDVMRIDSVMNSFQDGMNLWTLHDAKNIEKPTLGNIARKIQITSGWYDVQDVTNLLFGGKISTTMYYSELFEEDICMMGCGGMNPIFEDEYNEEVPNIKASDLKYRPTKITMKVMADMYFNQYSYLNEEINTNQVFTYLLLDESQNINLIGDQGNLISEGSINSFVNMYPGELTIETPTIYPNCPEIILSNSDLPFTIRADKVVVDSYMAGLSTFEYSVEAYSQIHLKPGAQIYRRFNFKINKSTYGGETSAPASPSEVSSFCSTGSYNAGSASAISKERSRIYDQIAENKNQI